MPEPELLLFADQRKLMPHVPRQARRSSAHNANLILKHLPEETFDQLLPHLEAVPLPRGTLLCEPGKTPRYVFFVTSGIASTVIDLERGVTTEVNLVGHEGLAGALHLTGNMEPHHRIFMQIAGTAFRIPFAEAQEQFGRSEPFRTQVLRFLQSQTVILEQLATCNRLHEADQRLARWLLMVNDRVGSPELALTQEFLADMLGSRRSTVALAVGTLQKSSLIESHRGRVHVLDRTGLEKKACECYAVMHGAWAQLQKPL